MNALEYTEETVQVSAVSMRKANRKPRKVEELAASIAAEGLINRVLLRRLETGFELIGGDRRLRAHQHLGRETIDARVYDVDDEKAEELAEVDNLQREDLTPIEEAEAYQRLLDTCGSTAELARRVGRTDTHVRQRMMLTDLVPEIRAMVDAETQEAKPAAKGKAKGAKAKKGGETAQQRPSLGRLTSAARARRPSPRVTATPGCRSSSRERPVR